MAGNRRITVGKITTGKLRGKAMSDALYEALCSNADEDGVSNK